MWINTQSDLIRRVLSPALGLWLRSLLERVEKLDINLQGHDRQILKGYIPSVSVHSCDAIYQGLHLEEVYLTGENIRINIGQILKGKPFRLLEPIKVTGKLRLQETNLNNSLSSFILSNAFTDLLVHLLKLNNITNPKQVLENYQIIWQQVSLNNNEFLLQGLMSDRSQTLPLKLCASLELVNAQTLQIKPKELKIVPELANLSLKSFEVDLGSDVELEQLSLETGQLLCSGRAVVQN